MTDIVWLLRNDVPCNGDIGCADELCNQAADEIERLRNVLENVEQARVLQGKTIIDADNEIERLRKALLVAADNLEYRGGYVDSDIAIAAIRKLGEE